MAPSDDLKAHAASNQDFYALLEVSPAATESEIRRQYRRTALKYHPDKIANPTPADIDKFHVLQIAYDVLSDPAIRQLYDNAREARERKQRERDMMDAAKRKMREDLEARERAGAAGMSAQRGVKRSWMSAAATTGLDGDDAEEKLQREIERIAEDGRRRRREAEELLKREVEEEEKKLQEEQKKAQEASDRSSQRIDRSQEGGTNVPELERAVKVRWVREGRGLALDKDQLALLFSQFGKVENTFMLKDKRQRVGDKREKKTVATCVVVYTSIVAAHAAVVDSERKKKQSPELADDTYALIESVVWASGSTPDFGTALNGHLDDSSQSREEAAAPSVQETPSIPTPSKPSFNFTAAKKATADTSDRKPGKTPSFTSFSSAAAASMSRAAGGQTPAGTGPSFQELTLMRLKNAQREKERKALEEQLCKEDEAADAA
ncbi:hypothetical protein ASPZODRAFT_50118, partial [Penicilliopsis zonata CBS 506.65]